MSLETTDQLIARLDEAQQKIWPVDHTVAELLADCRERLLILEERRADERQAARTFYASTLRWERKYREIKAELTRRIYE